jgi:phospholipid/cholesterol/gamma-HCH transport system permease protein
LIGCYKGFTARAEASGAAKAATSAMVIASITILIVDYFLTLILF